MKHLIPALLLLASTHFSFGQTNSPERRPGEILVQLDNNADLQRTLALLNEAAQGTVALKQSIAPNWHIHLLAFDENKIAAADFLALARHTTGIRLAQWNHRITDRIFPNDPNWNQQDDMTLIGAPDAWSTATGGLSNAGDTIVVAVLEKGILLTHPDIAPNRWHNWAEIPNNDIDDDNNGYVDDFGGWDARNDGDGTGANNNHGTAVTGIIGARGNNSEGVTGVNWTVQLMGISNTEFEDEIIKAYYYAGQARRLYNQTNGAKGAFVVATNASFGLDKEKAEDHPFWCEVYDSLGKIGILGVGATTNQNTNVDLEGDMPTSCTSEFLITVNNTDKLGNKMPATGYGAQSIDLGAPGNDTYTTANNGNNSPSYAPLGGTSAAAPHVTGAVGLLYSVPCATLTSDALTAPADCARRVRDFILDNTKANTSLQNVTTTGGHLQLANTVAAAAELCNNPLSILEIRTSSDKNIFEVYYQLPTSEKYTFRVFNMLGQLLYEDELSQNPVKYDASDLPVGVYVMSIGRGKTIVSRKFPKI